MKKLIIFDFDGTLVDLKADWEGLRQSLRKYFSQRGFDLEFRPIWEKVNEAIRMIGDDEENIMADVCRMTDKTECENIDKAIESEGVKKILECLKRRGFLLAVLSDNGRACVQRVLKRFHIFEYFGAVITRNDGFGFKPSKAGIEFLLKNFGVEKEDALLVGDSWKDLKAARNAEIGFVLVGKDNQGLINKPDRIIKTIKDLGDILGV